MAGKGKPGPAPGHRVGGRVKGTPNKINRDIREMILGALTAVGGQRWLERQAEANPTAFMALVGKILPTQVAVSDTRQLAEYTREELLAMLATARASAEDEVTERPSQVH
jgi:hypothetical protein